MIRIRQSGRIFYQQFQIVKSVSCDRLMMMIVQIRLIVQMNPMVTHDSDIVVFFVLFSLSTDMRCSSNKFYFLLVTVSVYM